MTTHLELTNEAAKVLIVASKGAENWPDYNSAHEVLGLLDEEFHEFKEEVYKKQAMRSPDKLRKELHDIAAIAIRAASLVTDEWTKR